MTAGPSERKPPREPPPAGGRGRWRHPRVGALIGLLCGLLGFAVAAQVHSNQRSALPSARQEDLVRILDDLSNREDRLRSEIAELQAAKTGIGSGSDRTSAALVEARRRAQELGVLAGTVRAQGPGLILTVREGSKHIPAEVLLDSLEELRGAGTEAVQLSDSGGHAVRVGTSTWFADAGGGVSVDGTRLTPPYQFRAIGDPTTMAAALNIPGGVADTVRQAGGSLDISPSASVAVTALRPLVAPAYARPAK